MCSQEVLGLKDFENVHDSFHEDFIDQVQRLEEDTCTYCTSLPWKQGTDSREIKKCHAKAGEDAEIWRVSHCYVPAVRRRDHIAGARNTHWRSHTLHSPPTNNQGPGRVYRDEDSAWLLTLGQFIRTVFEWMFGSWTPSAACDLWHSSTKSFVVAVYYRGLRTKRLFFTLKRAQGMEMPFVCYRTRTLTQGQLLSIDTPEWFSGQDLVLTFSAWHSRNMWASILKSFLIRLMSCWTTLMWTMSSQAEITVIRAISWL